MATEKLELQLRDLGRERAPAGLLPSVLAAIAPESFVELATEIGPVFVVLGPNGISAVQRAESETEFRAWAEMALGRPVQPAANAAELRRQLRGALEGEPSPLRYDLRGLTPFEQDVLMKALEIPRGEVRTYGWIAREIGRPKAVRAVGSALARNPIPLFIPCHRVVRSDGAIGQYGCGGPVNKRRLLLHEGVPETALGRTLAI